MQPASDLSYLIDPIGADAFLSEYWEQKPLVVTRQDPAYYRHLLTLTDVDHILSTSSVKSANLRVVNEGKETPVSELLQAHPAGVITGLELLYERYRAGSTIVLNALHERWEPLAGLCRSLTNELSAISQVNVYLTPRSARGLRTHYDMHDVFVLQIEGSKRWRLFEAPLRLPLASQPYRGTDPGQLLEELELKPGDMIYVPRGFVHDATSTGGASLHLTVGVFPVLWASLFRNALEAIIKSDSRFREGLPPGFAFDEALQRQARERFSDLLRLLPEKMSPETVIGEATTRALLGRLPALSGHLLDLEAEPSLSLDTAVRRRAELRWRLTQEADRVCLEFHGKTIRLPRHVAPDLRFVTASERGDFTARELPGSLDDAGRLVLVGSLVREGFLTVADGGTGAP